jgi:hypothetical protein
MKAIKFTGWLLAATMLLTFSACSKSNPPASTPVSNDINNVKEPSKVKEESWPVPLRKSKIASQNPKYRAIEDIVQYNKSIITYELKSKPSTLPEASNSSIPYWTGFALENKLFRNFQDNRWWRITDGSTYFYEEQIKFISNEGFNCARVLYSLSFLTNPSNILEVDESELEQLDELISWGMKYNVHIMLSISGLPGKLTKGIAEENVLSNDEIFRNPKLAEIVNKYLTMLAARYSDIPNRNLSFEILAEPSVPNGSLEIYEKVLTPIVKSMFQASPNRILIVNDLAKQVPEKLAALGCCLSLHNHIYTTDRSHLPDIDFKPTWPMEYLPSFLNSEEEHTLKLQSESEFDAGIFSMYITEGSMKVIADNKVLLSTSRGKTGWIDVQFPRGTKKISIKSSGGNATFTAVKIKSGEKEPLTLVVHDLYTGSYNEAAPTILIKDDGTTQNIDSPEKILGAKYFTTQYLQKFIECANKYNVGFLATEVGGSGGLTKEEFKSYHLEWLKAFKDNNIPWMYNCLHLVLCPDNTFKEDTLYTSGFTNFDRIDQYPLVKNTEVLEFLRQFR